MAETILTPGKNKNSDTESTPTINPEEYLKVGGLLSEFPEESLSTVRSNLGVLPAESVYTKEDVDREIIDKVNSAINVHTEVKSHITEEDLNNKLKDFVRIDGKTPFNNPQAGAEPEYPHDLTTKSYVDNELAKKLSTSEKVKILDQVTSILRDYIKQEDVYRKEDVYTKDEIDKTKLVNYMPIDGSRAFTSSPSGPRPTLRSHLATRGFVEDALETHKTEADPHNFIDILNKRLKKYALKGTVYDTTQTYSRKEINDIIDKLVEAAVEETLRLHTDSYDPHNTLDKVKEFGYIPSNGSVAFTAPQKGVDAVNPRDLVTLRQLRNLSEELKTDISHIPEPVWKTSGPVESTVGHVEDNTPVPATMTLQEVCDAIFYGKSICLEVPESVAITETCPVTMCIHGSTGLIDCAELLQDGMGIATLYKEDFEDGCYTINSEPLYSDTQFIFRVHYTNGAVHEETKTVYCHLPIFVGLLPKWEFGNVVTMERLIELNNADIEGTQNRFLNYGKDLKTFTFRYKFQDADLRHPFVVLPESYPNLDNMTTSSQKFGINAFALDTFDVIDMIPMRIPSMDKNITYKPMRIPGIDGDTIIYKMYIYKQALSSLNQDVTFNFVPKNE